MARYIDADKLKKDLIEKGFYPAIVARAIEQAETVEGSPLIHAHWKYIGMMPDASYIYECSKCGRRIFIDWTFLLKDYPSCHCGARMDEEENEK